jgi:hypothetical protein
MNNSIILRKKDTITKIESPNIFLLKRIGWDRFRQCQIILLDADTQIITYKFTSCQMPQHPHYMTLNFFESFAFVGNRGLTLVREHDEFDSAL